MEHLTGQDWSLWRWIGSMIVSAVCGLVGGVWWTRGKVAQMEEMDRRLALVEGRCDRQKQEIVEMIRSEVRSEIRIAIAEHSGRIGDRLGEITATLAGMAAHLDEARQDIVALFDRRQQQLPGTPHRRRSDFE